MTNPEERLSDAIVELVKRDYNPNTVNFSAIMRVLESVHDALCDWGAHPAMPTEEAELFVAVGTILFGDRWKSDMAAALGGIGVGTVDDWGKGRRPIPIRVWQELAPLLEDRYRRLPSLLAPVRAAGRDNPPVRGGASAMTFREYLATRRITDTPAGDFTADALRDGAMPEVQSWEDLRSYLMRRAGFGVQKEVIAAAREVWAGYQRKLRS